MSALRFALLYLLAALAPLRAANVLYFRDDPIGVDRLAAALASLNHTVTIASGAADFQTKIQSGNYEMGIFFVQNRAASDYAEAIQALSAFVAGGGRAFYADWSQNASLAAGFGAGFTGRANERQTTLVDLQPGNTLVREPLTLRNTGWYQLSTGLTALPGSTVAAQFSNGDAAVVRGPSGRSLMFGFLNDTPQYTDYFRRGIEAVFGAPRGPTITRSDGATTLAVHGATVSGTVSPNYAATDVVIDFGVSETYDRQTPPLSIGSGGASIPVSVALPNLAAHTTYHYRIRAMNVEGTITTDDLTFATLDTAPIAMNDRFTAPGNAPFNVLPVANDVDPDGDALVIDSVASGAFGRTSFSGNMVTYSPGVQGLRADQFQYTINDEFGGTSSASVTIEMPLAPFKGSYSHLLTGQSGLAGRIDLVMGGVGGFTATVMLGDERHALRGRFGSDGFARVVEHRQRASDLVLTLDLRLTSGGPRVTGALTDGINTWEIDVGGVLYDAGSRPFGSGARFTLVVGDSGLETMPRGDGWAIIKGSNDGHLRFGGAFADGSSFVAAALVYPDGSIPTYILRRRKPTQWLSGTLQLSGSAGAEAIDGEFAWTRPSEGFTATSIVRGSRFQRPLDANGMFVFANPARPRLLATLGGLAPDADIRHDLSARLGRLFVDDPNGDRFRMRFSRTTGRYTGGIIHPALGSARIGGVLLQRDNVVRGSFYGSGFGGAFRIEPR